MNENLKYDIRLALHTKDYQTLLDYIPSFTYEDAVDYIKKYQDNFEAMQKRMRNCESVEKEQLKEEKILLTLQSLCVEKENDKIRGGL